MRDKGYALCVQIEDAIKNSCFEKDFPLYKIRDKLKELSDDHLAATINFIDAWFEELNQMSVYDEELDYEASCLWVLKACAELDKKERDTIKEIFG